MIGECAADVRAPLGHLPPPEPLVIDKPCRHRPRLIRQVGHYRLRHHIASGGMGAVFLGWDRFRQREVAIKLFNHTACCAAGPALEPAIAEEARIAAMLRHPNIVSLYDAGVAGSYSYLVMEYIEGGATLKPFTRPQTLLSVATVVGIIAGCARALDYMHHRGVLHLDIKPGNVLVGRLWQPKISDFGISLAARQNARPPRGVAGSPGYMAPEQIRGLPLDARADLFSLATLAHELLTGQRPPMPKPGRGAGRALPDPVLEVLARAMAWRRRDRFDTAREFALALAEATAGLRARETADAPPAASSIQQVACGAVIRQRRE